MNYTIELELGSSDKGPVASGIVWFEDFISVAVTIWNRKDGTAVSWPFRSYQDRNGETRYDNQIGFANDEDKNELENAILDEVERLENEDSKPKGRHSENVARKPAARGSKKTNDDDDDDGSGVPGKTPRSLRQPAKEQTNTGRHRFRTGK